MLRFAVGKLGETVGLYATAYLDAARVVLAHAAEARGLVDLYFYPAALCLRHGIELLTKQISNYIAYVLRDPELLYVPGHSLQAAWQRCREKAYEMISHNDSDGEHGDLKGALALLDSLIVELDAIDPDGQLFRYPEIVHFDKKTERQVGRKDRHVPFDRVDLANWTAKAEAQ